MEFLSIEQFVSWLEPGGISLELTPETWGELQLSSSSSYSVEVGPCDEELNVICDLGPFLRYAMDDWTECCLWKRQPKWRPSEEPHLRAELERILVSDYVPIDTAGAVCLQKNEVSILHRLLLAQCLCGFALADDVFIVPNCRKPSFISIDHHGLICLTCSEEAKARQVHKALLKERIDAGIWKKDADGTEHVLSGE